MTTREGLFQAVLHDPDDISVRLILADWLEEQGDETDRARGELIRRQCQMPKLIPNGREWNEQHQAIQALLKRHGRDWNGPLHEYLHRNGLVYAVSSRRGSIKPWVYRRGFIEALHLHASIFVDHAQVLFQLGPIRHLKLWNALDCLRELISCPFLARVYTLDLCGNGLIDADARFLASSVHLHTLRNLYLTGNPIRAAGQHALKRAFPQTQIHYAGWAQDVIGKVDGLLVTW